MNDNDPKRPAHACCGDAAAYVLGALEPAEAERFHKHLGDCAICGDEVQALQGAVRALPMAAPQYTAPTALKRRTLREVHGGAGTPARKRRPTLRPWSVAWPALTAAAAAAVIVAGSLAGFLATAGPGGRVIQARVSGGTGRAEVRIAEGRAELVVRHLPPAAPGQVYEVWLKAPGGPPKPTSVLFEVTSSGDASVGVPQSVRGVSEVLVTPEPDGGSPQPTHPPVIVARLT